MIDDVDDLLDRIAAGTLEEEAELRVYADQLILRGDPLGELIVVAGDRVRRDTPELARREGALIAEHDAALNRALGRPRTTYRWRRGFVDAITFHHTGDEQLERSLPALAGRRETRLLRRIEVHTVAIDGRGDLGPWFASLARFAPHFPRLGEIVIREDPNAGNPWLVDSPVALHDVSPLYGAYPGLEVLELDGTSLELHDIVLPNVRRFLATRLAADDARRIVAAELPRLADLELSFAIRHRGNIPATFGPLLHREFPHLEALSLALQAVDDQLWMIRELAAAPIARRVRRLAFRRARLDVRCIERLIADRARYRVLEVLELPAVGLAAALQQRLSRTYGAVLKLV